MTFQVANGSLRESVDRFLRERLGMELLPPCPTREDWILTWAIRWPDQILWDAAPFDWPHDREPTLQEAIEAVMGQR